MIKCECARILSSECPQKLIELTILPKTSSFPLGEINAGPNPIDLTDKPALSLFFENKGKTVTYLYNILKLL